MARKNRKIMKRRGHRNTGRGRKGSRKETSGGVGMAGSHKHKFTWIVINEPDWFGKHGMRLKYRKPKPKAVNIGDLDNYAEKNNLKEIDVEQLGYQKVLGGGKISKPLTVKASTITQSAKQKIQAAGGKAIETKPVEAKPEAKPAGTDSAKPVSK